ncbi:WXG100 family type VII secretion target [Mycobacterium sp. MYCO198283]|uniref:WXG100 family type VII secretion target n=1 Tax=Mycobacterium sp. MYCO198283 TaxID=2883505 RepID=UPI001E32A21B|nr:WXG100 family type VII secretion target [Mycobacterium sp. MYCO198283]MCG5433836.1 WXG100 family type VII secretion target [Mycobacterium sp. MYCO198283]
MSIRVDSALVAGAARAVADDAEALRAELARISDEWDGLSGGWSGAAASAYASLFDEWHSGASRVVEALTRSSELLSGAAAAYSEREAASAQAVQAVTHGVEL